MSELNKGVSLTPEQKNQLGNYFKKQFCFFLLALVFVLITVAFIVIKNLGIEIFKNYFLFVVLCTGGFAILCFALTAICNAKMRKFLIKIEDENKSE